MRPSSKPSHLSIEQARKVLSRVRNFSGLPPHVQNEIARVAIPRQFDSGQVIFMEGEPANCLYILESGWVKASRISPEGREQAMLFLKNGDIFGDVAVLTNTPYPGTVVALEPVKVWAIEKSDILNLITRNPDLAMVVIRNLGERILYYIGLVEDLSLRSVEARLASTLLKNAELFDGRLVVKRQSWATYDKIANRLGTVRDVLSRSLRSLEEEGLLRVEKREIIILDPEGLARRGDS